MLYALGEPVAFVALLITFLLSLVLRTVAVRLTARSLGLVDRHEPLMPRLRDNVDPFGAVSAAIGGVGWGKSLSVDEIPRWRGRGRAAAVFAAGPLSCIVVAQLIFVVYKVVYPNGLLGFFHASDVLLAAYGNLVPLGEKVLLSFAVGFLTFGLLAIVPIPPLDGFGILYSALRKPGPSMQWMRLWFEEKNLGVVLLLALALFPFGAPWMLSVINILAEVFLRAWS